jgi:hypothetical protein
MKTIKKTENKGKNEKRKRKETRAGRQKRAENADGRRARAHAAIAIACGPRASMHAAARESSRAMLGARLGPEQDFLPISAPDDADKRLLS